MKALFMIIMETVSFVNYVSKLKKILSTAHQMSTEFLALSQEKIKVNFDKKSVDQSFEPSDLVLVFLPVRKTSLEPK